MKTEIKFNPETNAIEISPEDLLSIMHRLVLLSTSMSEEFSMKDIYKHTLQMNDLHTFTFIAGNNSQRLKDIDLFNNIIKEAGILVINPKYNHEKSIKIIEDDCIRDGVLIGDKLKEALDKGYKIIKHFNHPAVGKVYQLEYTKS